MSGQRTGMYKHTYIVLKKPAYSYPLLYQQATRVIEKQEKKWKDEISYK